MPIPKKYKNELEYVEAELGFELDKSDFKLDEDGRLIRLSITSQGLTDISFLENLTSLIYLNLFINEIRDISSLANLILLQKLDLASNQISDISALANLTSLQELDLSDNQISDITSLANLTSLQELDLSDNQISDITSLANLTSLRELDLSTNQIRDITTLANLTSLRELILYYNKINNITFLSNLISLQQLDLDFNNINDISSLSNLINLTKLYISGAKLSNYNILKKFTKLKTLHIAHNYLKNIEFLKFSPSLESLDFSKNVVFDINILKELNNLKELRIYNNQIQDLSVLSHLKKLQVIWLSQNPCAKNENLKPRENHIEFLKLWLEKNKLKDKELVLFPKKVVFLGNHASGKSSLLHYFEKVIYAEDTKTTHVLNILKWKAKGENLKYIKSLFTKKYLAKNILPVMFYDFGGQDFYHGLYQSFSSKTAFQIVVYCADQIEIVLEEDSKGYKTYKYPLSFWLKEKEYLERGTQNPYFIVENKIDDKAENSFAKDFPNIIDFENPKGIFHVFLKELTDKDHSKELQNQLQLEYLKKQLLQELYEEKEVSASMTAFFQNVYDDSTKPKLTIKERTAYEVDGISPENMLTQLRLLESSGVLFLSEDTHRVITNPQAFIQYIHTKVLEQKALFEVCGRLTKQQWNELNNGEYAKLIEDFMIKQKTMFYDKNSEEYVFPNYLSLYSEDEERHFLTVSESLLAFSVQLKYFLPFGFINVLIHHFGQEPNKKKFWRDAIYFIKHVDDQPKANVFINLNIKQLCIDVYIEASDPEFDVQSYKRYLWLCLATMYEQGKLISWEAFLELRKTSKSEKADMKFEDGRLLFFQSKFPKTAKVSTDGKFYTTLSNLEERIKKNEYDIYLDNQEGRSSRLPLYKFQVFTEKPINKMKKIFISYSNEDIHYKKELEKFLKPLKEFQLAQSWSCEELNAELWHDKIQEELESSDIVIFMMSMNFASSEYILKEEVHKTFEHLKTHKNKKIVCVLVRQFPWKVFSEYKDVLGEAIFNEDEHKAAIALTKLPEHQFLPYDIENGNQKDEAKRVLKPLNQWEFQEEAYTQIIKVLSKIL